MKFLVGLQRSGTSFAAHLLNSSGKIDALHEHLIVLTCYQLFRAAQAYHEKKLDGASVRQLIKCYDLRPEIGIDANFLLTFILPPLLEEFPDAKIVHLVRGPKDTVRSCFNEFDLYGETFSTLGFQTEFMRWCVSQNRPWQYGFVKEALEFAPRIDVPGWDRLSRFEKICHYWVAGHKLILDAASKRKDYLRVPLEKLVKDQDTARAVLEFCELPVPKPEKLQRVMESRVNSSSSGPLWGEIRRIKAELKMEALGKYEEWPAAYKASLKRICGPMAAELGYPIED